MEGFAKPRLKCLKPWQSMSRRNSSHCSTNWPATSAAGTAHKLRFWMSGLRITRRSCELQNLVIWAQHRPTPHEGQTPALKWRTAGPLAKIAQMSIRSAMLRASSSSARFLGKRICQRYAMLRVRSRWQGCVDPSNFGEYLCLMWGVVFAEPRD